MPPASPLVSSLRLLAAALLALGVCACSAHGKGAPPIADQKPGPPARPREADVSVLDPGAEPRALLRYRFAAGASERLVMELVSELKLTVGEMSPPPVRAPAVHVTIELRTSASPPHATLEGKLVGVEVPDDPALKPEVIAAVRSDLERLAGTTWSALCTDRGHLEWLSLSAPPDSNTQLATTLDRIRDALSLLLPPLPEAPVGQDARWELRRRATIGPARVEETIIYKLGFEGDHPQLQVTVGMIGREQPLLVPGTPPGATLMLGTLEGGGKGVVDLDLAQVAQASTLRWSALGKGTAQPAGEPQAAVLLNLDASITVKRR